MHRYLIICIRMASNKEGFLTKVGHLLRSIGRGIRSFWQWYKSIYVGRPWYVKTASAIASFVVFVVIYSLMVFFNFMWLFGKSPSISSIMNPKTNNASYVYSADGQLLCKFFDENRTPVKFEEVSPLFSRHLSTPRTSASTTTAAWTSRAWAVLRKTLSCISAPVVLPPSRSSW